MLVPAQSAEVNYNKGWWRWNSKLMKSHDKKMTSSLLWSYCSMLHGSFGPSYTGQRCMISCLATSCFFQNLDESYDACEDRADIVICNAYIGFSSPFLFLLLQYCFTRDSLITDLVYLIRWSGCFFSHILMTQWCTFGWFAGHDSSIVLRSPNCY